MSADTPIQYPDSTVNPVGGCCGCELWTGLVKACYSGNGTELKEGKVRSFAESFDIPELFPGRMAEAAGWSDLTGKTRRGKYPKPWLDYYPRIIFVSDYGDALSEGIYRDAGDYATAKDKRTAKRGDLHEGGIPFEYLKREIIDVVLSPEGRRHIWLWLSKRPARMAAFAKWLRETHGIPWPENLWAGASITSVATLGRIRDLERVGAAVAFLSVEPLLEMVFLREHLAACPSVKWIIVGGESNQREWKAREFKVEWVRSIRDDCRKLDIAYFVKQLGSLVTEGGKRLALKDSHGGDWEEWPKDLRVRELPSARSDRPDHRGGGR